MTYGDARPGQCRLDRPALFENITGQQLQCLCALAEVGGEFLSLTGIADNSSVQRALNSLVKKRILFRDGKRHRPCDPFFREWIGLTRP